MNALETENREYFTGCDPELLAELVPREEVFVLPARKEGLTMTVGGRFVHGKYHPLRDAVTLVEKESGPPKALHLHFGFGLGWLLQADTAAPDGQILVFEPDPGIAAAALAQVPLAALFAAKNARLFCDLERLRRYLRGRLSRGQEVRLLLNPYHVQVHPQACEALQEAIRLELNRTNLMQAEGVKKIFQGFLSSTLRSLPYTTRLPGANRLVDAFKDVPAVIVAAGPSLDKNLTELAAVWQQALVFAISRAVRPLATMGIQPHFLVQTEAKNYLYLVERCTNLAGTTLLLADQCDAGYFQFPTRYKFCYQNPGNVVTSWLVSRFPQLRRQFLATAGSVATDAFSLALVCGCNPIILVGQDLALSKARYYADADTNVPFRHKKEDLAPINGYFGGQVPTVSNYLYFASWYEDAVKLYQERYPNRVFINATEGGANLRGFRNMKLRDAARLYFKEKVDPGPVLEEASLIPATFTMTPAQLRAFLKEVRSKLDALLAQCGLFQMFHGQFSKDLANLSAENMNRVQEQLVRMEQFQNVLLEYCNDLKPLVSFCNEPFLPGAEMGDYPDLASLAAALTDDLRRVTFNYQQVEDAARKFGGLLAEVCQEMDAEQGTATP